MVRWLALTCVVFFLVACSGKKPVQRDTTITPKTSFNNLFLDSVELDKFMAANKTYEGFETQYNDFYKHRNYEYAWIDSAGLAEQTHNFINLLNNTIYQLQDSSLYNARLYKLVDELSKDTLHTTPQTTLLQTELLLTGQFFLYASKVYNGSDVDAAELGWFIPRKKIDLTAVLDAAIKEKGKEDVYAPLNTQYQKMQAFVLQYAQLQKQPWDSLPALQKPLKKGDSTLLISSIKQRLYLLGDLKTNDTTYLFDSTLQKAVKNFQVRMGLDADGSIGNKLIAELNVTPAIRLQQILINLERVRWLPKEKDTNYIVVNIPEYKMHVYDSGQLQFDIKVIVGTAANSTVIFNNNLQYIVFSPYWNVPYSIVKNEIAPAIKRNSNYLQRNNMEVTGYSGGLPVVRQKPGPGNSLGLVKFLFPNNYNIYFHDTPNRNLFSRSSRSFSHGCIRVGEPKKLAAYLLRNDTAWNSQTIDSAMHLAQEKWVSLKKPVPVFIIYLTSWVDQQGRLNFAKDIYKHDEKMATKLFTR
jgi:murein L,D-transpeptidase YcbB/YkuD